MEQELQEQANKLQRYEAKLRDIIAAYKKLQVENESLQDRLQAAESVQSRIEGELEQKTKALDEQCTRISELVLENDKYRKEVETIPLLKRKLSQLTGDLEAEQKTSKKLNDALLEVNEQHEASTHYFETRISDIISTLKSYQEIHHRDTETIKQLRSGRATEHIKETSECVFEKESLVDYVSRMVNSKNSEPVSSRMGLLFDLLTPIWSAIVELSSLQQLNVEKKLVRHLDLKSVVPTECLEACEKEKSDLKEELDASKSRLTELQELTRKSPQSTSLMSHALRASLSLDINSADVDKQKLQSKLQEAQDNIKLLRNQNLAILLELESVKKSMQSKIAGACNEATQRLSEATARFEVQLAQAESEARRYREQTLSLLNEKEEEIAELRAALLPSSSASASSFALRSPSSLHVEEPDSSTSLGPAFNEEPATHCGLVHCAEKHGRLVTELKKLRRSKRDLEQRIEALEARNREDRKILLEANRTTKTEAAPTPSVDVNMAYVKNIVFNLLSSLNASSISSRLAIIKALVMALHFSQDEENALINGMMN
uniref:GRIP domain-containing protein n=1 Tax=Mesocestoides corti TaxID=53468 RepID=A0A5K3EWB4_MESCO